MRIDKSIESKLPVAKLRKKCYTYLTITDDTSLTTEDRMNISAKQLSLIYNRAHNLMRNIDGLQPQEAFDELLKYLFFKIQNEKMGFKLDDYRLLISEGSFGKNEIRTAKKIKKLFREYLEQTNSSAKQTWPDCKFHLSDNALIEIHDIFKFLRFSEIDIDIKSSALRSFLTPEIRKGLGIFLTPDVVVKMIIEYIQPERGQKILDPACGSGTFLIEALKYWTENKKSNSKYKLWGVDKNPRMLLLSDLNLNYSNNCIFNGKLDDFLFPKSTEANSRLKANFFDVIVTNPPFGVVLDAKHFNLDSFSSSLHTNGTVIKRQSSEILFLEQCLRFLKPGGKLGIVLPKGVITNSTFSTARKAINTLGYVTDVIFLPPETFSISGTQTTTIVLFMKKFKKEEELDEIRIGVANVENVGYDSTGRTVDGNQLHSLASELGDVKQTLTPKGVCTVSSPVKKNESLCRLNDLLTVENVSKETIKLEDVVLCIRTGRTPPRKEYSSGGLFLIKVGNLTGNGINWIPRDRNFVDSSEAAKRLDGGKHLMVQKYDILLTSSAHSPVYIAEKVDMVSRISESIGGKASYVGEVMLVRPNPEKIDPYMLLIYLKSDFAKTKIQNMIRGQTAHLHAEDIKNLLLPKVLLSPTQKLKETSDLLKRELEINEEKNELKFKLIEALDSFNL